MTTAVVRTMTVLTSEAHLLAVAGRFDLVVIVDDGVMEARRPLGEAGELVYLSRIAA